jgi:hypothetical protein
MGDITVIALKGLAYSAASVAEGLGNDVCKEGGLRASARAVGLLWFGDRTVWDVVWVGGGEYGGGGVGKGAASGKLVTRIWSKTIATE